MEVDYQLALLLQHKFEKEAQQSKKTNVMDSEFATSLQNQFTKESELDVEGQKLSYKQKSKTNSSKSLVDPSWEVIDPTPDIHMLFMAFNERFFWNKLVAVCVSWSKRMTSCAGICSYQGRGGMCSITLSEPLLKLRPRKDLVETLLHEMIHAFLFVTHNNKDRDGHGMEFQKHMFRINAEAGTHITIYHDFYDEVRLYKQHWWRCDGPCQKWKPYYGFVKRATNRAPAPNDRWWGEHSRSCGGNFIKVKEPEKPAQKSKKDGNTAKTSAKTNTSKSSNIQTYFPPTKNKSNSTSSVKTKSQSSVTSTVTIKKPNSQQSTDVAQVISKSSNIFGFTQLNNGDSNGSHYKPTVFNDNTNSSSKTKPHRSSSVTSLNNASNGNDTNYSQVRNAWINKFTSSSSVKRNHSDSEDEEKPSSSKIPKSNNNQKYKKTDPNSGNVNCPVCDKLCDINELNSHLDQCLENGKDAKDCIICGKQINLNAYEKHVIQCTQDTFDDDVFEVYDSNEDHKTEGSVKGNAEAFQLCEICKKMVETEDFELHIGECLNSMYDNLNEKYSNQTVNCLACDKSIPKDELNNHLENCGGLSRIFDDENMPTEDK